MNVTIDEIENELAQTQCTECGFDGCRPYAEALVRGNAEINLCRPGGEKVVQGLATLLDKEILLPAKALEAPQIAQINQSQCIGCTICIQACPTDAFFGAPKMVHGLMEEDCTGCKLCVPVCPTNCISMVPADMPSHSKQRAAKIRDLVEAKNDRKRAKKAEKLALKNQGQKREEKGLSAEMLAKIETVRAETRKNLREKHTK